MQNLSNHHSYPSVFLDFLEEDQVANKAFFSGATGLTGELELSSLQQTTDYAPLTSSQAEALKDLLEQPLEILGNHPQGFPFKIFTTLRELLQWKIEALKEIKGSLSPEDLPSFFMFGTAVNYYLPPDYRQSILNEVLTKIQERQHAIHAPSWMTSHLKHQLAHLPATYYFEVIYPNCTQEVLEKIHGKVLEKLYILSQHSLDLPQAVARLSKLKTKILTGVCQKSFLHSLVKDVDCNIANPRLVETLFKVEVCYQKYIEKIQKNYSVFCFKHVKKNKAVFYHFYDSVAAKTPELPSHRLTLKLDSLLGLQSELITPKNSHTSLPEVLFNQVTDLIHFSENFYHARTWPLFLAQMSQNGRCRNAKTQEQALSVFIRNSSRKELSFSEMLIDHLKRESRILEKDLNVTLAFCYNMSSALRHKRGNLYRKEIQEAWRYLFDYIDSLEKFENKQCSPFFEKIQILMRDPSFAFDDLHAIVHCLCYIYLNVPQNHTRKNSFSVALTQSDGFEPHIQMRLYSKSEPIQDRDFVTLLFPLDHVLFLHLKKISKSRMKTLHILQDWMLDQNPPFFSPLQSCLAPLKGLPEFQFQQIKKNIKELTCEDSSLESQLEWPLVGTILAQEVDASFWKEVMLGWAKKYAQRFFFEGLEYLLLLGKPLLSTRDLRNFDHLVQDFKNNKCSETCLPLVIEMMLMEQRAVQEAGFQLFFNLMRTFSHEQLFEFFPQLFEAFEQQHRLDQLGRFLNLVFNQRSLSALNCLLDYLLIHSFKDRGIRLIEYLYVQLPLDFMKNASEQVKAAEIKLNQLLALLFANHECLILAKLFKILLPLNFWKNDSSSACIWVKLALLFPENEEFKWVFYVHLKLGHEFKLWKCLKDSQKSLLINRLEKFLTLKDKQNQSFHSIFQRWKSGKSLEDEVLNHFKQDLLDSVLKRLQACTDFSEWKALSQEVGDRGLDSSWSLDSEFIKFFLKLPKLEDEEVLSKQDLLYFENFFIQFINNYQTTHLQEVLELLVSLIKKTACKLHQSEAILWLIFPSLDATIDDISPIFFNHLEILLEWLGHTPAMKEIIPFNFWQKFLLLIENDLEKFLLGLCFLGQYYDPTEYERSPNYEFTEKLKSFCEKNDFSDHPSLLQWIFRSLYSSEGSFTNKLYARILKQKVERSDWLGAYQWLMEYKPRQMKQRIEEIISVISGLNEKGFYTQALELLNNYYTPIIKFSTCSHEIVRVLYDERQFPMLAQFLLDSNLEEVPSTLAGFLNDCLDGLIRMTKLMMDINARISKSFKPFTLVCRLLMRYKLGSPGQCQQVYHFVKSSNHKSIKAQMLKFLHFNEFNIPKKMMADFYLCSLKGLEHSGAKILIEMCEDLTKFSNRLAQPEYVPYAQNILDSFFTGLISFLSINSQERKIVSKIAEWIDKYLACHETLRLQRLCLYQVFFNFLEGSEQNVLSALTLLDLSIKNGYLDQKDEQLALQVSDYLFNHGSLIDKAFKNLRMIESIVLDLAETLMSEFPQKMDVLKILKFLKQHPFKKDCLVLKGSALKIIFENRLPAETALIESTCWEIVNSKSLYRRRFVKEGFVHPFSRGYIQDRNLNDKINQIAKHYPYNITKKKMDILIDEIVIVFLLVIRSLSVYLNLPKDGKRIFGFKILRYEKSALKHLTVLSLSSTILMLGLIIGNRLTARDED